MLKTRRRRRRWWKGILSPPIIRGCTERAEPVFEKRREIGVTRVNYFSYVEDELRNGDVVGTVDEVFYDAVDPRGGFVHATAGSRREL